MEAVGRGQFFHKPQFAENSGFVVVTRRPPAAQLLERPRNITAEKVTVRNLNKGEQHLTWLPAWLLNMYPPNARSPAL